MYVDAVTRWYVSMARQLEHSRLARMLGEHAPALPATMLPIDSFVATGDLRAGLLGYTRVDRAVEIVIGCPTVVRGNKVGWSDAGIPEAERRYFSLLYLLLAASRTGTRRVYERAHREQYVQETESIPLSYCYDLRNYTVSVLAKVLREAYPRQSTLGIGAAVGIDAQVVLDLDAVLDRGPGRVSLLQFPIYLMAVEYDGIGWVVEARQG